MFGKSKEVNKGKEEQGAAEKNEWDSLEKESSFSGDEPKRSIGYDMRQEVKHDEETMDAARAALIDAYEKNGNRPSEETEKAKEYIEFLKRSSSEGQMEQRRVFEKEQAAQERAHERSQDENAAWELRQRVEEHSMNEERYGADIEASAARRGFVADEFDMNVFAGKIKRAEEKEKGMDPKERTAAFMKRQKEGLVWTDEKRHIYEDIKRHSVSDSAKEEYGRQKEKLFRELSEIRGKHPIKFRKVSKKMGVKLPKNWDDRGVSKYELQSLRFAVEFLAEKK